MNDHDTSKPAAPDPWDLGFGVVVLAGAATALLVWFPLDIQGGFMEPGSDGTPEPGDAFFPVLLASALLGLSILHLAVATLRRRPATTGSGEPAGRLTPDNIRFFLLFHAVVVAGMAVVYWFGPLLVAALGGAGLLDATYRQLTDTAPYKYLGYVVGGGAMTLVLMAWAEGGLRPRAVATVALVLAALVGLFDGLLSNVQLPPNADY